MTSAFSRRVREAVQDVGLLALMLLSLPLAVFALGTPIALLVRGVLALFGR